MARLPKPDGMTLAEFGKRLWGKGPDEARFRFEIIGLELLHELGCDCDLIRYWRDRYETEARRGRGGQTAIERAHLLERCFQLLDC